MEREPKGKKTIIAKIWRLENINGKLGSYPYWGRRQKDYVNPEKKKKIKDI